MHDRLKRLMNAMGTIVVDLGRITANRKALAEKVLGARCAAIVKADGYMGLGCATSG